MRFEFKHVIYFIALIYGLRSALRSVPPLESATITWNGKSVETLSTRNMRRTLYNSAVTKRFILNSDHGEPTSFYVSASFPHFPGNYCNLKINKAPPASDFVFGNVLKFRPCTPSEKFTVDK